MDLELFSDFFASEKRQRSLKTATFLMFIMLALEKVISGTSAAYKNGTVVFDFSLEIVDLICIAIYVSTATLIALQVRYERLVIPDFFLLVVKLYIIIAETVFLLTNKTASFLEKFSAGEHIIEAVLFGAFLICMFIGELSHGKRMPNFSSVCMNLLMICFPMTVLLEIGKVIIENKVHLNHFVIVFNFVRDVLSEAFLDVPYFLLILMVCLTANKGHKKPCAN